MGLEDLRHKMLLLSRQFGSELPAKIRELERLCEPLREPDAGPEAWAAARIAAHRMRGTAGTLGFKEVSAQAGRVEKRLVAMAAGEHDGDLESLWVWLAELAALCEIAGRESTE